MLFEKIEQLCRDNGTNITSLCREITGSTGNLPTWKKDNFRVDAIAEICIKFNVSADYLLGLTDSPMPLNTLSSEDMEALENGRKIKNLPDRDRKIIEAILESKI